MAKKSSARRKRGFFSRAKKCFPWISSKSETTSVSLAEADEEAQENLLLKEVTKQNATLWDRLDNLFGLHTELSNKVGDIQQSITDIKLLILSIEAKRQDVFQKNLLSTKIMIDRSQSASLDQFPHGDCIIRSGERISHVQTAEVHTSLNESISREIPFESVNASEISDSFDNGSELDTNVKPVFVEPTINSLQTGSLFHQITSSELGCRNFNESSESISAQLTDSPGGFKDDHLDWVESFSRRTEETVKVRDIVNKIEAKSKAVVSASELKGIQKIHRPLLPHSLYSSGELTSQNKIKSNENHAGDIQRVRFFENSNQVNSKLGITEPVSGISGHFPTNQIGSSSYIKSKFYNPKRLSYMGFDTRTLEKQDPSQTTSTATTICGSKRCDEENTKVDISPPNPNLYSYLRLSSKTGLFTFSKKDKTEIMDKENGESARKENHEANQTNEECETPKNILKNSGLDAATGDIIEDKTFQEHLPIVQVDTGNHKYDVSGSGDDVHDNDLDLNIMSNLKATPEISASLSVGEENIQELCADTASTSEFLSLTMDSLETGQRIGRFLIVSRSQDLPDPQEELMHDDNFVSFRASKEDLPSVDSL